MIRPMVHPCSLDTRDCSTCAWSEIWAAEDRLVCASPAVAAGEIDGIATLVHAWRAGTTFDALGFPVPSPTPCSGWAPAWGTE